MYFMMKDYPIVAYDVSYGHSDIWTFGLSDHVFIRFEFLNSRLPLEFPFTFFVTRTRTSSGPRAPILGIMHHGSKL